MRRQDIEFLIKLVDRSTLSEVSLRTAGCTLTIRKEGTSHFSAPEPLRPEPSPPSTSQKEGTAELNRERQQYVKAPMVGTFYTASDPASPPFVRVGDTIEKGQKVCIIEAMKVFNEIESDVAGTVTQILVENASPVEYDQPLFTVE